MKEKQVSSTVTILKTYFVATVFFMTELSKMS